MFYGNLMFYGMLIILVHVGFIVVNYLYNIYIFISRTTVAYLFYSIMINTFFFWLVSFTIKCNSGLLLKCIIKYICSKL